MTNAHPEASQSQAQSRTPKSPPPRSIPSSIFGVEGTVFYMALDPIALLADGILLEEVPPEGIPYIIVSAPDISAPIDQVTTTTGAAIVGMMNPAHLLRPPEQVPPEPPPDTLSAGTASDVMGSAHKPASSSFGGSGSSKPVKKA